MIAATVRDFLVQNNATYTHTQHPKAYTALSEAREDHTPARETAKTVVVEAGGQFVLIVLAANTRIDWQKLQRVLGVPEVRLATEKELARIFPDVELGAIPPLGSMYNLPVYVDSHMAGETGIAFHAGTHTDTIHMPFAQFCRVTEPKIRSFAVPV